MRTAVIVLGDLGRSPRMQFHALALAQAGVDVDLVGLDGAPVHAAVAAESRIAEHRIADRAFPSRTRGGVRRFVLFSVFRAVHQAWRLFSQLLRLPKPDVILVQNPPAVPTLAVAWAVARIRGARFLIDWHNLAHTIASIRLGEQHRVVRSLARSERRWARRADGHFTVSQALADWLAREYRVKATVLYDRPPRLFTKPSVGHASALREKLVSEGTLPAARVPLVVCPTSWTPDEDFDLLLEAIERAERELADRTPSGGGNPSGLPGLSLILTGRGALRENFDRRVARRKLSAISVRTAWLTPEDYPVFIGMADLGLCLHQSSSGLDLPMKIQDFRGAGVPVAAFDYAPVLGEVLTRGHEGTTFRDPGELAAILVALALGQTQPDSPLGQSKHWLAANTAIRWEGEWREVAAPVMNL